MFAEVIIDQDVKAIDKEKYKALTGQAIDKYNKFLETCQAKNKKLWLRQVIVPGYNDTKEDILKLKDYIKNIKNVERVELLPYHSMAKDKYKNLGIKYRLENVLDMDKEKCKQLEKLLND